MVGMLELPDQEFKVTMINILRTLMDKVHRVQEQMGKVSREMEILRKNQKRNARDEKHFNRNKACLLWAHYQT